MPHPLPSWWGDDGGWDAASGNINHGRQLNPPDCSVVEFDGNIQGSGVDLHQFPWLDRVDSSEWAGRLLIKCPSGARGACGVPTFTEPAHQPVESGPRWHGNYARTVLRGQHLYDLSHQAVSGSRGLVDVLFEYLYHGSTTS